MTERRKRLRVKCQAGVVVTRYNGNQISGQAMNLSLEGIALRMEQPLVCGENTEILLDLEDGQGPLCIQAEVAYNVGVTTPVQAYQVGLSFPVLADDIRARLEEWIYSRAERLAPQPLTNILGLHK